MASTIIIHDQRKCLIRPLPSTYSGDSFYYLLLYKILAIDDRPCKVLHYIIYMYIVVRRTDADGPGMDFCLTYTYYTYTLTAGILASDTRTFSDRLTAPSRNPGPLSTGWEQRKLSRPRRWSTAVVSSSCCEPGQTHDGSRQCYIATKTTATRIASCRDYARTT